MYICSVVVTFFLGNKVSEAVNNRKGCKETHV